jgi:hypothetical protein
LTIPRVLLAASLAGSVGLAGACRRAEPIPVGSLPPELQPLANAEVERSERHSAEIVVSYFNEATYPADQVIAAIEAQIGETWKPLDHLKRNESIRSSRLRGWSGFVDTTSRPISYVHQWWSEWEKDDGALLTYVLEFRSPVRSVDPALVLESPTVTLLHVTGSIEVGTDPPKPQGGPAPVDHDRKAEVRESESMRGSGAASASFALRPLSAERTAAARDSATLDGRTYFFDG